MPGFFYALWSSRYLCLVHLDHRSIFLKHLAQTSNSPLMIEISHAGGNYLYTSDNRKLLDLISGISVCNLGHGRPEIVAAIADQAGKHMHTMVYGELIQSPQVKLAKALTSVLPTSLDACYFVNSGSEAVEGAMKLAKRFTGRQNFVALTQAYHGSTQGALSLMSNEYFSSAFRPLLPNIFFIEQNRIEGLEQITKETAAVIIEPVQAEKGAFPCTPEYVQALRSKCNETGTLLIFDEIQTGMGRTGTLFAFEHLGVLPDILLLGKAFGGGMPLGAFIAGQNIMQSLADNPVLGHITTFGGHPVCCAASLAALEITINELHSYQVSEKEKLFRELALKYNLGEIQGKGLLLSLDMGTDSRCKAVIDRCIEAGLFTDWFLFAPHRLRIAPPLTITPDEIHFAMKTIAVALSA